MAAPIRTFLHRIVLSRGGTEWFNFELEQVGQSFEEYGRGVVAVAGTYYNLRQVGGLASGGTRTTKLRKSANPGTRTGGGAPTLTFADTTLSAAHSNPTSSSQNTGDSIHFDAGDFQAWKTIHSPGTAGSDIMHMSVDFEPDNADETPYNWSTPSHQSGTLYVPMFSGVNAGWSSATIQAPYDIIAVDCQLTRYDPCGWNTPGGANGYKFTVIVNGVAQDGTGGTVDTRCQFTGSNWTTTWTGTLNLVRGDLVLLKREDIGTPSTMAIGCASCLKSLEPGLYNKFVSRIINPSSTLDVYRGFESGITYETTEANVKTQGGLSDLRLSGMIAHFSEGNVGAGSITITGRLNEAPVTSGPTLVATGNVTSGIFEDVSGGVMTISNADYFSLKHAPLSIPNVSNPESIAFQAGTATTPPAALSVTEIGVLVFTDEIADADIPPEADPCAGGGTVESGTDPAEGDSLSNSKFPKAWMEITPLGGSTLRLAKEGIPHGFPKRSGVKNFGKIHRKMTDSHGGPQRSYVNSLLVDTKDTIKALDISGTLERALVEYFISDLTTIRAGGDPHRVFRGRIEKAQPLANKMYEISVEDELTSMLSSLDGEDLQVPQTLVDLDLVDDPQSPMFQAPVPDPYGSVSDEVLGDNALGRWELKYLDTQVIAGHEEKGPLAMFLITDAVIADVQSVFGGSLYEQPMVSREKIPDIAFDDWIWCPHKGAYLFADPWYEVNGQRWSIVFGKSDHPVIIEAVLGRIPLTMNFCARETVGDGTGTTIDSPPRGFLHWLNNRVVQFTTGDWLPIADIGDYSMFKTSTFEDVHTICDSLGLKLQGVLGYDFTQKSWRDRIAEWCQYGFDLATNRDGQQICVMLDPEEDGATAAEFTEQHVLENGVRIIRNADKIKNRIRYVNNRNYRSALQNITPPEGEISWREPHDAEWLSGQQKLDDTTSIIALGDEPKGVRLSDVRECTLIYSDSIALTVNTAYRDLWSPPNGRWEAEYDLTLRDGWEKELGDIIKLKHRDVPWTGFRRCQVREITLDLDEFIITHVARDVDDLLA